ncbi:Choline transport protein [Pseudocercospora fuligena]|uniref:Choline transport protein n=1 Tax=Pseudocercospora fuligena TaxID=685502 RepID=A0A8H6RTB7_9PEZI|nr:Choline transport protein [Pseudocercospora fuligena]
MPALEGGRGHQSNRVVWMEWAADVGYPEAVVFVSGMLNGAFAMGTPDAISHLAEEIHSPETNVPKAMALQIGLGFISGFAFLVPMLYAINDFDALQTSSFPLGELYRQATWTNAGAIGLLCVTLLPVLGCVIGLYVTAGRTLWTLARDGATPRSAYFGKVHRSLAMPMRATLLSAVLTTLIGGIALASSTAFQSFVSSFIQMSTASYMASLMPFVLRRRRGLRFGPFKMPDILGMCVNSAACIYMVLAFGIYCLPSSLPTSAKTINYAPVIWAGCTALIALFWTCFAGKRYSGPRLPIT